MNQNDQAWLVNRVHAALHDDFYLDREEEQRIKEEAATRGIAVNGTQLVIRSELERIGALCERTVLEELDALLHKFTDDDKLLGGKEERGVLDQVLAVTPDRKRGLDPRVAEEYVNSFCRVNGVRRHSETKRFSRTTRKPMDDLDMETTLSFRGLQRPRGVVQDPRNPQQTEIDHTDLAHNGAVFANRACNDAQCNLQLDLMD